jgi:hypothetical protein
MLRSENRLACEKGDFLNFLKIKNLLQRGGLRGCAGIKNKKKAAEQLACKPTIAVRQTSG